MKDHQKLALLVLLFTSIGFAVAGVMENRCVFNLEREAIRRGFAEYNPTNGNWQWRAPK